MKAVHLKTNYRVNPMGIESGVLRFTWNCEGGCEQRAYQVTVTDEEGKDRYDSGRVEAGCMYCEPEGLNLESRQRMNWTVRLWDEEGKEELSAPAWFETGIAPRDWKARWISTGRKAGKERLPAEYFRKTFSLKKKVKKARLYATACGVYTAWINGRRLPGVMAPGSTEYPKRLYYHTYDVTGVLQEENTLSFALLDGWYMGKLGYLNVTNRFGNMRKLLAQMEIEFEDGGRQLICTDEDFSCSWDGPIRYADLKDGEAYDSRMVPTYHEKPVPVEHGVLPTASPADMIENQERFSGTLICTPSGKKVLDFGQNLAGYVCFSVKGKAGQVIRLSMGEVLDHGEFSRATLIEKNRPDEIRQEIVFTCNGERQHFRPEGFYSGFRYALVEGLEEIVPGDFEAVAIYTKMDLVGEFECSNLKINRFYQNTLWSLKSNFVDVPTDCPQREKSGWDGDAQVFLPTASYMADVASFFRKWLRDVRDCQRKDGRVANVSPSAHKHQDKETLSGAVGWADAAVIIPYTLWKLYGDERFISENLELMLGWSNYVLKAAGNKWMKRLSAFPPANKMFGPYYVTKSPFERYVIESGMHWGEWMEPDIDSIAEQMQPKPELTSAYTHYSMRLLAEMLEAVGRKPEAEECRAFSEGARQAYRFYFVKAGHITVPGQSGQNRQAPMVRALALGLLDEETAKSVAADLNESAIKRNYTVGTGFLSTPYVLEVLTNYGYLDTAYKMLENTKAPGWLAMVEGGATTVWETYVMYDEEGHPLGHSMNHYSPGAVCAFLFNTVCGIRVDGERRFVIAPLPGGTLEHARARYRSPYGEVSCRWERKEDGRILYHVEVPANCTAVIRLPGGRVENVCTGTYEIVE